MSVDPYHAVQSEIQTSLQSAENLRASFLRIRSTASEGNEELNWVRDELKGTLAALEADLEDLEASVKIVEETGGRMFGLDDREVMSRREYVNHVRSEIENMRFELLPKDVQARTVRPAAPARPSSPYSPTPAAQEDDQAAWSREEQQMMIHQQDETLTSIQGTLRTLATQAGLIGQETAEQNEMLDDLGQRVDRTEGRLGSAMKRMQKFIRETEETKSGWCIMILIVILCALLLAVILV
ncbi:hypothetical protein DL93DRAFT_2218269 [Clavulina sp. PMI_390]|nr:hypothetical protein DL93DRAFT_2218269 [Clavulina sp. PMI_390]